jgi:ATP-binding cassette subfamily B protein
MKILQEFIECYRIIHPSSKRLSWLFLLLVASFFTIVSQSLQVAIPFLSKLIIDLVIVEKNTQLFSTIAIIVLGVVIISGIFNLIANNFFFSIFFKAGVDLKTSFFSRFQSARLSVFNVYSKSDISFRLLNDTEKLIAFMAQFFAVIPLTLVVIGVGIFMAIWNWQLSTLIFAILIGHSFVIISFNRPLFKTAFQIKEISQAINSFLVDIFARIELIKCLNTQDFEKNRFYNKLRDQYAIVKKNFLINKYSETITIFLNNIWVFVVLWYGGLQVLHNRISLGTLIAFLLLSNVLYRPITIIVNLILAFQETKASVIRILEYYSLTENREKDINTGNNLYNNFNITFSNVTYAYKVESQFNRPALSNISFDICFKDFVAIIGSNGSGKSTLCKLLLRLIDPDNGKIIIGDKNVADYSLFSLRKNIFYSFQNMRLFNGTILDNITYFGAHSFNKKEILLSLKKADADFVNRLPLGLQTPISSEGIGLSGGESQKINIARALLHRSPVYIFDEPTSSIDKFGIENIANLFLSLKKESTVILITHNIELASKADKIILLKDGAIKAYGNPSELKIKENPLFQNLDQTV